MVSHRPVIGGPESLLPALVESFLSWSLCIACLVVSGYHYCVSTYIFPLFTKYVRPEYREAHNADWKSRSPKASLQDYIDGFCNENRWKKAIFHLKEKGELEQSPRDIGKLIAEIQNDLKTEEIDNIKDVLYKHFIGDITRRAIRGFPEWYKEILIDENLALPEEEQDESLPLSPKNKVIL